MGEAGTYPRVGVTRFDRPSPKLICRPDLFALLTRRINCRHTGLRVLGESRAAGLPYDAELVVSAAY